LNHSFIQRLDRMHADDAGGNSITQQGLGRQGGRIHRFSTGNKRDITALEQRDRPADLECRFSAMQVGHRLFAKADINWARVVYRRSNSSPCFKIIGGHDNIDIVNGLQDCQIVQRVVGGAKCAVADPGADTD
jgi:hypothetical protein